MAEPLILAFDTAAAHCAAVLVRGDAILARRNEPMDRGQAERLMPMLAEVLAEAGLAWTDLDGIGVCTGPGNFTGVRLAVAAARGLSLSLGIPAIGVTVFETLADTHPGPALVRLPDPKGGIFAQPFRDGVALAPPGIGLPDTLPDNAVQLGSETDRLRADPAILARIAARRLGRSGPPVPLYLRPADALPPSDPVPQLLDDA